MALDLSSLRRAVKALDEAIKSYKNNRNSESPDERDKETLKAGVIQNFEVAYELCWKFMKRWLDKNAPGEIIDGMTMKELFRTAAERRLIKNVPAWFVYHRARNLTSHTYDERNAGEAFEAAKKFISDAKALLRVLEEKND